MALTESPSRFEAIPSATPPRSNHLATSETSSTFRREVKFGKVVRGEGGMRLNVVTTCKLTSLAGPRPYAVFKDHMKLRHVADLSIRRLPQLPPLIRPRYRSPPTTDVLSKIPYGHSSKSQGDAHADERPKPLSYLDCAGIGSAERNAREERGSKCGREENHCQNGN